MKRTDWKKVLANIITALIMLCAIFGLLVLLRTIVTALF